MESLKLHMREKIEKEGGVMHSFSPEERMCFSQLINFNHRGDPDLADILPIDPNSMDLFNAVGTGILLCKMINHAVPGTIDHKLINVKKPLNVFQIKENLTQAIKGSQQLGCVIVSITPPLIMEKREHIILGMIWQVLKATLGLQVNLKNCPDMIRLKKLNEDLAAFQNLTTEETLLRWLNYHLRNAGSNRVAKNFSGDLKDGIIYTVVLNQLEPSKCDLSGLDLSEEERAAKVIDDTVKIGIPRFLRSEDILAGNPKLNLIFCGEIFNHCSGLVPIQPFSEGDRMAFAILISESHKNDEELTSKLPINPDSKDLLKVSKDGQLLTKMMNKAVSGTIDESKILFGENIDENSMITNLQNFLEGARSQDIPLEGIKPTMIIDEIEDLILFTIWEVLKKEANVKVNPANDSNLLRLKRPEEDANEFNKLSGAEPFLLRWINYHLRNAGKQKEIENFKDHLKDGTVYTILLNQLNAKLCDKLGLEDPEDIRISKAIDNAAKLGVPRFIRPVDVLHENEKLNLLFTAQIYYRASGLRPFENFSDADKFGLAILLSDRHKEDEDLKSFLPINPQSNDLFVTTAKSVLLSKMVGKADSNAIDLNHIKKEEENLEKEDQEENLRYSLEAAKNIGCDLENIGVSVILDQIPDLVLKILYEILKADLRNHLNIEHVPLLVELKNLEEDLEAFQKINDPENYLLRWINHHLRNSGSNKVISNFTSDLQDGTAYILLLNQLEPSQCDTSALEKSDEERAEKVINNASLLGVPKFLAPSDIINCNPNLNILFCSEIFWRNHGLEPKKDYSNEEKKCYARIINEKFKEDADLMETLPINPDSNALFSALKDGVILNKLVNEAVSGTIDPRAINTAKPLTSFQVNENLQLGLASAKSIGCHLEEITPVDILKGKENEDLKLLAEVLKAKVQDLNLKNHPYLLRLKKPEEEIGDLLRLSPEDFLKRWFNHHLKNAGNEKGIENFGADLADCVNFTLLLNQLDQDKIDKSGLNDELHQRAAKVLENSKLLGLKPFMEVDELLVANPNLNFLFAFDLFCSHPGLSVNEEEKYEAASLLKDDVGDSREERSFRMWVNSLKIPGISVNNLFEDIKDGIVLLKVLERVQTGCVEWKKVELKPNHRVKKIHNANYAVEIGKKIKFSLVNVGGIDLVDGKKKLALALMWQMVRKHTLELLGGWNEEKLLEWALERVKKEPKISSFKDKSISNCQFLFNLLATIEPRAINWDLVTPGNNSEEIENNCSYVLSIARKLGAVIFLVWEDIKDVNPRMIMTLIAALVRIEKGGKQEEMLDFTKKTETDL